MIAGTLSGLRGLRYAQAKGLGAENSWGAGHGGGGEQADGRFGGKKFSPETMPRVFPQTFCQGYDPGPGGVRDSGLSLEVLGQVLENCRDLEERGLGDLGTQALMVHYRPE